MVKLRFLTPAPQFGLRAGEEVWFDVERAARIVRDGIAEAIQGAELLPAPEPPASTAPARANEPESPKRKPNTKGK